MPLNFVLRHPFFLLTLLSLAFLAPGIWEPTGITGKDEFFLGLRTPMEMIAGDHWLVPFLDEAPRIRKPPLLYWIGRVAYETLGISLSSARAVAVLFGALLVVATAGIARRLTGDGRAAVMAGCILLGCLGLHSEARRFMLDVPVAALSACAFWCLLVWRDGSAGTRRHWIWLSLTATFLAAGFLVKGPVVGLLFGSGAVALAATGGFRGIPIRACGMALLLNILLLVALATPWFVVVGKLYPLAAETALNSEMEARGFLDFSPHIILGLLNVAMPWVFVFGAGLWAGRSDPRTRLLAVWFALTFLPFLFVRSFDRYLIGSLVPLAIFVAAFPLPPKVRWPWRAGALCAALVGGLLALFGWRFGLPGWWWALPAMAYLCWSWWKPRASAHTWAAPALFALALLWGVFPGYGVNAVPEAVVQLGRQQDIAFYRGPQPAMLPILSGRTHRHYPRLQAADLTRLAARHTPIFVEAGERDALFGELSAAGFRPRLLGEYRALASHGSGIRFARQGSHWNDWKSAWQARRLEPLMTTVAWYEVAPQ